MPITPWLQSLPQRIKSLPRRRPGFSSSMAVISSRIRCSVSCRFWFSAHICCASCAASSSSSLTSRENASFADPILPAAFIRGAIAKAMSCEVRREMSRPAASHSAISPGCSVQAMARRPCCTMMRFSPVSGTTSPIVPIAASSAKRSSAPSQSSSIAAQSFKATPAPHRSRYALVSSRR